LNNILFITHFGGLYGSNKSLLDLISELNNQEVKSHIVTPQEGLLKQIIEPKKTPLKILPVTWWMTTKKFSVSRLWQFFRKLYISQTNFDHFIKLWDIDLIYSNSSVFPVGRLAAIRNNIPHIWHLREFGDLDFSLKYILPKLLCRNFIRKSQAIICNSEAVRKHYFQGKSQNNVSVIYNGIASKAEFEALYQIKNKNKQNESFTFLMVGAISPKKGQETAIKALAKLKKNGINAKLIITGSGKDNYIQTCKQLVRKLGIEEDVSFTGYISDPYEVYFKSDCLLMCSEYEAFGRVTAEAMSACLPVIGRNSGGTPEVIADGETGILYNTFDELVAEMIKLVQNPEIGIQMGLAGWQRAKNLFNIEDYAANVYQVIQSVMD